MALIDEIRPGANVALDSDALIYYVEESPAYQHVVEPIMEALRDGTISAHISTIVLLEVLVKPFREGQSAIAEAYRRVLLGNEQVTLLPLTDRIAERAAAIRAASRIEVADAIVAASTMKSGCDFLLTNNEEDFRRVQGLDIRVIDNYI